MPESSSDDFIVPDFLTEEERAFVGEFLKDGNASRSIKATGYIGANPSDAARTIMARPHVAVAISDAYKTLIENLAYGAEEFHRRLIAEVDADMGDVFEEDGELKPVAAWPLIWRQGLITSVDVEEKRSQEEGVACRVLKIKFADRSKRLDMLGKHRSVKAFAATETKIEMGELDQLLDSLKPTLGPLSERDKDE